MEHWTDRLSEYVDGDLDTLTAASVDQHLAVCDECTAIVTDLRFIAKSAASLDDAAPPEHVWTGIATAISAPVAQHGDAADDVIRLDAHRSPRRSITMSMPQLAAAATVLLMIGGAVVASIGPRSAVTTVATTSTPTDAAADVADPRATVAEPNDGLGAGAGIPVQAVPAQDMQTAAAAPPSNDVRATTARERTPTGSSSSVRTASRGGSPAPVTVSAGYDAAIAELEAAAGLEDGRLDPATTRVLRQSMQTIDRAIADARAALATDPANGYLHRHLDRTMKQKLDLLRQASKIERGGA